MVGALPLSFILVRRHLTAGESQAAIGVVLALCSPVVALHHVFAGADSLCGQRAASDEPGVGGHRLLPEPAYWTSSPIDEGPGVESWMQLHVSGAGTAAYAGRVRKPEGPDPLRLFGNHRRDTWKLIVAIAWAPLAPHDVACRGVAAPVHRPTGPRSAIKLLPGTAGQRGASSG